MSAALPVTIIGGYLGSGKTTLINHLLRHANGVRLAVLINDFGELPIDAELIEGQEGNVISLSGGCICCSYGDDLSYALQQLLEQESLPDHIFIEASGVALPGAIGKSLSLLRAFKLEGIVVLADATSIETSSTAKYIGDTIARQLSDADLIVLNKLDLLSNLQLEAVRGWMEAHYTHSPWVDSVFSTIDPEVLFEMKRDINLHASASASASAVQCIKSDTTATSHHHEVASLFKSIRLDINKAIDADTLAAQLADKRCGLVRAKGFVLHADKSLKTIQVVGRRWSVTDAPDGVSTGLVCIATDGNLSEARVRAFCGLDKLGPA